MTPRITNILTKLNYLKQLDRNKEIFGAIQHNYRNEKISEDDVLLFENKIGAPLPSDFREFLINIGTGAGPDYGIYTFQQMIKEHEEWSLCLDPTSKIGNSCALTNKDAIEVIENKLTNPSGFFYKRLNTVNGILPIQTEGCTYYCFIVLNGEQTGRIWGVDSNEFDSLPSGITSQLYFSDWYETWLDKTILKLETASPNNAVGNKPKTWWQRIFN
jgi:hypothetical protein